MNQNEADIAKTLLCLWTTSLTFEPIELCVVVRGELKTYSMCRGILITQRDRRTNMIWRGEKVSVTKEVFLHEDQTFHMYRTYREKTDTDASWGQCVMRRYMGPTNDKDIVLTQSVLDLAYLDHPRQVRKRLSACWLVLAHHLVQTVDDRVLRTAGLEMRRRNLIA